MATRTIQTDIILGGEKEFNAAMKSVNSNLGVMQSEMKLLTAEFAGNENSVQALTSKQQVLADLEAQHAEKVRVLQARYDALADSTDADSAALDKARKELNSASAAHIKAARAVAENQESLDEAKRAANIFTRAMDAAKKAISGIGNAAKAAAPVVGTLAKGLLSVGGVGLKGIGALAKASAISVTALGTAGVAAIGIMSSYAKETAEAARAAQESGEQLTASQAKWLEFSDNLGVLDSAAASAKAALGGVLLPVLNDLSTEGAQLLSNFSAEMEAAAGDTGKQGQIMSKYIVQGARMIRDKLPEYTAMGKEFLSALGEGFAENSDELWDMGLDVVGGLLNAIIDSAPTLDAAGSSLVQKLTSALDEGGPDFAVAAVDMVSKLVTGLGENARELIPAAGRLINELLVALLDAAPDLLAAGADILISIADGITEALGLGKLSEVGPQVIDEIKAGINAGWDGLASWFKGIWDEVFGALTVGVNLVGTSDIDIGMGNIPGYANGLSRVPYDNYLARLHKDEMVLTKAQADWLRSGNWSTANQVQRNLYLTINAKQISQADLDMIDAYLDGKWGDEL